MTELVKLTFSPSKGQAEKLERAFEKNCETTIQIGTGKGDGEYYLFVPKMTLNRVKRNRAEGKGTRITIKRAKQQIPAKSNKKEGGSIFSGLAGLVGPIAKTVVRAAPTLAKSFIKNMATGVTQALGHLGLNKLFGKGGEPIIDNISPLLSHIVKDEKTRITGIQKLFGTKDPKKLKQAILAAVMGLRPEHRKVITENVKKLRGEGKVGRGTKTGGFLGTLAAIGIPLVMQLLGGVFGKGMENWRPPPFIGSWEGKGQKKR